MKRKLRPDVIGKTISGEVRTVIRTESDAPLNGIRRMTITELAHQYVEQHALAKTPIYSAKRFAKYRGDIEPAEITEQELRAFRKSAEANGVSAWTIRGTLKDLKTLLRSVGHDVRIEKVRMPQPDPRPVAIEDLETIWNFCPEWLQQFLAVSYWTAARLDDVIRMQKSLTEVPTVLQHVASKTQFRHRYPVPSWLRQWLQPVRLPYHSNFDWSGAVVRGALSEICKFSNVATILPNHVRDRSLNEWMRASPSAVGVLHGSHLGTLRHYVDPLLILESAAPRVRVPQCMLGDCKQVDAEGNLLDNFRKLDLQAQGLIASTAERLAAG